MQLSSITASSSQQRPIRAAVAGQEKPSGDAPLETYTPNFDDPVFRFSNVNVQPSTGGDSIHLQIRFPDENTHFQAFYDDKTQTIVFPTKPAVQDPEEFLIAK